MEYEHPPAEQSLDTYMLDARSLSQWHQFLTTDPRTGQRTGNLDCPGSRYGRTATDCAWWAIAAELVIADANGIEYQIELSLDHMMGLVVNDHDDVAELVRDNWESLPAVLRDELGDADL